MSEKKHESDEDGMTTAYGWGERKGPFLSFDANYGRDGVFGVVHGKCMGCGEEKKCLHVDQSEGEYNAGLICLDCIGRLFGVAPGKKLRDEIAEYRLVLAGIAAEHRIHKMNAAADVIDRFLAKHETVTP